MIRTGLMYLIVDACIGVLFRSISRSVDVPSGFDFRSLVPGYVYWFTFKSGKTHRLQFSGMDGNDLICGVCDVELESEGYYRNEEIYVDASYIECVVPVNTVMVRVRP